MRVSQPIGERLLSLVYPERATCLFCDAPVDRGAPRICEKCSREVLHKGKLCPRCGRSATGASCIHCRGRSLRFSEARSLGSHEGKLRELILRLKYAGKSVLGRSLGCLMADLLDDKLWQDAVALVPVPLDRAKAKQRGYNQAEIIARGISSRTGIPILRVIEAAGGEDQISLSAAGRTRNAAERFRLTADAVLMGKYIIVDDVLTTGSTASACAALLYQIGATDVRVATAAATYAGRNDQLTRRIEG